jgi:simple sugar transport system permease protein
LTLPSGQINLGALQNTFQENGFLTLAGTANQYSGGDVTYGRDFVFDAPVAAVIGGVLLTGGHGSAIGVFLGSVIFGVVNMGIFYTGWNSDLAQLVLGTLLLLAVLGNNYFRKLALTGR